MTRSSADSSNQEVTQTPVTGLHANFVLLSNFNEAIGKEVLVEAKDGSVHNGIFAGASHQMELGLYCAYEKTSDNEKNLLPRMKDLVEKRQFEWGDVLCVTVPLSDDKKIKHFATDRDYHQNARKNGEEAEFEEWQGDGEGEDLEIDSLAAASSRSMACRNGGWGVDAMFDANDKLGVTSTFNDDMSQYTTAEVAGTEEDRRKAEAIAREIEGSGQSKQYAALENDDEERDLDKATTQFSQGGDRSKRLSNTSRSNLKPTAAAVNRRAEGLKDSSKEFRRSSNSGRGVQATAVQKQQRPAREEETPIDVWKGPPTTKTFENRNYKDKMLLESRSAATVPLPLSSARGATPSSGGSGSSPRGPAPTTGSSASSPRGPAPTTGSSASSPRGLAPSTGGPPSSARGPTHSSPQTTNPSQRTANVGRVENLRNWNTEFSNNYRENRPVKGEKTEEEGVPVMAAAGNAWKAGPPCSLLGAREEGGEGASAEADNSTLSNYNEKSISSDPNKANESGISSIGTSTSSSKKFEFNPDAPAFTPKSVESPSSQAPPPPLPPPGMLPLPGMLQQQQLLYSSYSQQATPFVMQQMGVGGSPYQCVVNGNGIVAGGGRPISAANQRRPATTNMPGGSMYMTGGMTGYQSSPLVSQQPFPMQYYTQQYGVGAVPPATPYSVQPQARSFGAGQAMMAVAGRYADAQHMHIQQGNAPVTAAGGSSSQGSNGHAPSQPGSNGHAPSQPGSNGHAPSQPPTPGPQPVPSPLYYGGQALPVYMPQPILHSYEAAQSEAGEHIHMHPMQQSFHTGYSHPYYQQPPPPHLLRQGSLPTQYAPPPAAFHPQGVPPSAPPSSQTGGPN